MVRAVDPTPPSYDFEVNGAHVVLRLAGDLDATNADRLRASLDLVVPDDVAELRVEASGLTSLDSAAVRVLLRLRDGVTAAGGRFRLEGLPAAQRDELGRAGVLGQLDAGVRDD